MVCSIPRPLLLLLLLGALSSASAQAALQAQVLVVDSEGHPGSQFTSLQAAVDAAQPGDVVLVRSGRYEPLSIIGKPLTVAAEQQDSLVRVGAKGGGPSAVAQIPAGGRVVLRGLRFESAWARGTFPGTTLTLADSPGLLWVQNCTVLDGSPSLRVSHCDQVVVSDCHVFGQAGAGGGHGALVAEHARLVVHQGSFQGASGQSADVSLSDGLVVRARPGGLAARLIGGEVEWIGGAILGGSGGNGYGLNGWCLPPAPGGAALLLEGGILMRVRQPQVAGGPGGNPIHCSPTSAPGAPLDLVAGQIIPLPGQPAELLAPSPIRVGEFIRVTLEGPPGNLAFLIFSPFPGLLDAGPFGMLLVSPKGIKWPLGSLPASGQAAFTQPLAPFPGVAFLQRFIHSALCAPALGTCGLGASSTILALPAHL